MNNVTGELDLISLHPSKTKVQLAACVNVANGRLDERELLRSRGQQALSGLLSVEGKGLCLGPNAWKRSLSHLG